MFIQLHTGNRCGNEMAQVDGARHDPMILVCGCCGIPVVSDEKVDDANEFCDMLRQKWV